MHATSEPFPRRFLKIPCYRDANVAHETEIARVVDDDDNMTIIQFLHRFRF